MRGVYIIQSGDHHKIGMSDNISERIEAIQISTPYDIIVTHCFETDHPQEAEALLHRIFKHKRVRGEWFLLSASDLNFLAGIGGFLDGSFTWLNKPVPGASTPNTERPLKMFYTQDFQGQRFTFTERHILDFLQTAWRRQQDGRFGLSRRYWMRQRRPPMQRPIYDNICQLLAASNLIINRKRGGSGQLATPPQEAMGILLKHLEN